MKAAIEETTRIGRTMALCLATASAALLLALAATADTAEAEENKDKKIVFSSNMISATGVNNPTGDDEIFVMNPDGTELQQLTSNTVDDFIPTLSPDSEKIAFVSSETQSSNPEGDPEIYLMNTDGSNQQNLTNTSGDISDFSPDYSPDGEQIAYTSFGVQSSNPEGENDIYLIEADGSGRQNLTDTDGAIVDFDPGFSSNGKKIAYTSFGVQSSNPEGDREIYVMKADGSNQQNLTDTNSDIKDESPDYSPDGEEIAYSSSGVRSSNPEGDSEVYKMKTDGSKQKNRSDTGGDVDDSEPDYSPDGKKIAYESDGAQLSNPEGDFEIYKMNDDGSNKQNLTENGIGVNDLSPDFGKAKTE